MTTENTEQLLAKCLEDLENRIDPETELKLERDWRNFLDGDSSGGLFAPARGGKSPAAFDWPRVSVNESLDNIDLMLIREFSDCSRKLAEGSGLLMNVRSNYGTGILPSLFGAEVFRMPPEMNTLPTTRPVENTDIIRGHIRAGIPDLRGGFGYDVFRCAERVSEIQIRYPKIGRFVHHYHPDLQGPFDVCELLVGSRLFTDIVDEPQMIKDYLSLITDTYAAFLNQWNAISPATSPYTAHWGAMCKGLVMLRNDSLMNVSPDMYREFALEHDTRIFREFGGGAFHFCGRGDHYIDIAMAIPGITALAMSQPAYNDMERIFKHTVDKGIKLILFDRKTATNAMASGRNLHGNVQIQ